MGIYCSYSGRKVWEMGQDSCSVCFSGGSASLCFGFNLKPAFSQSQDRCFLSKKSTLISPPPPTPSPRILSLLCWGQNEWPKLCTVWIASCTTFWTTHTWLDQTWLMNSSAPRKTMISLDQPELTERARQVWPHQITRKLRGGRSRGQQFVAHWKNVWRKASEAIPLLPLVLS